MTGVIIDIVLLLVMVVFVAVGYFRGFLKTVLSLLGTVGSLLIAYFVKGFVAGVLNSWFGVNKLIADAVKGQITNISPTFSSVSVSTVEELLTVISESDAGLVYKKIFSWLIPDVVSGTTTVADAVGLAIGNVATIVIAFVLVFVLIKILVFVLNLIIKKIPKRSFVGKANQILGAVAGLVNGIVLVATVVTVLYFICMIPAVNEFVSPVLQQTYISKYIYALFGKILLK